ncbi:hypothetical protein FB45DRAFT_417038 [Roridomyces roridus]|uniref:Uncharacterized protein n=1 Tax=Roridomyces roridus TaxID=1738132 RepID=A0AAD7C4V5_9AGAR|nr:hypothetical protein FB45DRAFT_417038 [Roridomyces roridus]
MPKLTASQLEQAQSMGVQVYNLLRLAEIHRVFLAERMEATAEVYAQFETQPPQVQQQITDADLPALLADVENLSQDVLQRVRAMTNCLGLVQYFYRKAASKSQRLLGEVQHIADVLDKEAFAAQTAPAPQAASSPAPPAMSWQHTHPRALLTFPLVSADVAGPQGRPLSAQELHEFRQNSDELRGKKFTFVNDEGEPDAYRVVGTIALEESKPFFYLVFLNEGPEAFTHVEDELFSLLERSFHVE